MTVADPNVVTGFGVGVAITLALPVYSVGDKLIAWISFEGGVAVTPPLQWLLISRQDYVSEFSLSAYQKFATGAEPASYTWTLASSQKWTGGIAAYASAGQITNFVGRSDQYGTKAFDTSAITVGQSGSRVIALMAQQAPATWIAPAGGWVVQGSNRTGARAKNNEVASALLDIPVAAAGVEPAATAITVVAGDCYYFQRDGNTFASDALIKGYLADYGFTVVTGDMDSPTALTDSDSADLTFVSPSVFSSRPDALDSTVTPFLLCKGFSSDNLGMAGPTANVDYGINDTPFTTAFEIVDVGHPLAAGLSGSVQPYTGDLPSPDGRSVWSNPHNLVGANLAFKETAAARYYQYGLPPGYVFFDGSTTKPVRWGYTFVDSNNLISAQGEALVKAAIDWTARSRENSQIVLMLDLPPTLISGGGQATFPAIVAAGVGSGGIEGTGQSTMPAIAGAGSGVVTRLGTGQITMPAIAGAGSGVVTRLGTGQITMPAIATAGLGTLLGTGQAAMPAVVAAGAGEIIRLGTGQAALPAIVAAGIGGEVEVIIGTGQAAISAIAAAGSDTAAPFPADRVVGVPTENRTVTLPVSSR